MTELDDNSKPAEVVAHIGQCIALYPDELRSDEVAWHIVNLGCYDWDNALSHRYDSYCEMSDLASDMEWQEQPEDWAKLLELYERLKVEVLQ